METNILYSTGCPKCGLLKKVLEQKGIEYTVEDDVNKMLELGIDEVPMLKIQGKLMNYDGALRYIKERKF